MTQSQVISPRELKSKLPLTEAANVFIDRTRQQIRDVLNRVDDRLLLIAGPCSIHDIDGAIEYAKRLKELSKAVEKRFLVVMRAYVEKPRTALGWKGLLHDPYLDGSHRIEEGIHAARKLLLNLSELQMPAACEFLDPLTALYNGDLISWACIGARTSASQVHRQMASALPMPIAFKNCTGGNISTAVNGCLQAMHSHTFLAPDQDGQLSLTHSKGNPDAHIVLRGGDGKPNYDESSIASAIEFLKKAQLPLRILIDCSHDNSEKKHYLQPKGFAAALEQHGKGNSAIRGVMIESYLESGNQPHSKDPSALKFGLSITDPCLSWQETESLVLGAL